MADENNNEILLSICVVTYNRWDGNDRALASIFRFANAVRLEVIVVDNNSSDDTVALITEKYPNVAIIRNTSNYGYAPAMNQAFSKARGEFVMTLSSDGECTPTTIPGLMDFLKTHPRAGLAGPRTTNGNGEINTTLHHPNLMVAIWGDILSLKQWLRRHPGMRRLLGKLFPNSSGLTSDYLTTHEAPVLDGGCLMTRRSVLKVVGLLDSHVILGPDDYDWCFRMRRAGFETWFVTESEAIHRQSPREKPYESTPSYLRIVLPGMCYVYGKHHDRVRTKLLCWSALILNKKWQVQVRKQLGKNSTHLQALRDAAVLCLHPERFASEANILWKK